MQPTSTQTHVINAAIAAADADTDQVAIAVEQRRIDASKKARANARRERNARLKIKRAEDRIRARESIGHLDKLPDDALISASSFAALIDAGLSTIWRRAKDDPDFPQCIRLGKKCTRWRMGDVRAFLEGTAK